MKDYKILLISFVLLVFMIGAVSAADVNSSDDVMTTNDESAVGIDLPGIIIPDIPIGPGDDDDEPVDVEVTTKEIYVSDTGNDSNVGSKESPYATIKKAYSDVNASNGATIYIGEGTYLLEESTVHYVEDEEEWDEEYNGLYIDLNHKSFGGNLKFIGAGADKTFLDGQSAFYFATVNSKAKVLIKDVTFINCKNDVGGTILNYGNLTVENCVFKDSYAIGAQGGAISSSDPMAGMIFGQTSEIYLTVKNSQFISSSVNTYQKSGGMIIIGPQAPQGGGAISAYSITELYLENNTFINTRLAPNGGMGAAVLSSQTKTYLINNKFINLTGSEDAALYLNPSDGSTGSKKSTVTGNVFINCTNPSSSSSIVNLNSGSYKFENNTFINASNSIGNIYNLGYIEKLNFEVVDKVINISNGEINNGISILFNVTDDMGNIVKTTDLSIKFKNDNATYTFYPSLNDNSALIRFSNVPDNGIYDLTISYNNGQSGTDVLATVNVNALNNPFDLYVSPNGSDENNGTVESPFATIQNAINVGFEKTYTVIVHLLKGTYSGDGNVELTIANKGNLQIIGEAYNETIIDGNNANWFLSVSTTQVTAENLTFANGKANRNLISGSTLYLKDCIVDSNAVNRASYYVMSDVSFDNLIYTNNKGSIYYSYINDDEFIISNGYFANNDNSELNYGVLYIRANFPVVENCTFINNTARQYGAAIYPSFALTSRNNKYIGNTAPNKAVIYMADNSRANFIFENDIFINNKATSGNYGVTGVAPSSSDYNFAFLNFTKCQFINNSAVEGGAIGLKQGSLTNCSFINNSADYGGAIAIIPISTTDGNSFEEITFNNVIFENNNASNGKDLYFDQTYSQSTYYSINFVRLTVDFNDLNVSSLSDTLTVNITGPCEAIVGGGNIDLTLNGSKIGTSEIINGVAEFTYDGFEDGIYTFSGSSKYANENSSINEGTVVVKLEGVLDSVTYWVSANGSDENGNGSESNPFKSISHAVEEATKNCRNITIYLGEGNFTGENNTSLSLSAMYNIAIIGSGVDKTIIDGENTNYFATISEGKNTISITDLTIKNMLPDNRQSQTIDSSVPITIGEGATLLLDNVEISDNHGGNTIIVNNGNLIIDNSIITRNGLSKGLIAGGNVTVSNSEIFDNYFMGGNNYKGAIDCDLIIVNNTIFKGNYIIVNPSRLNTFDFVLIKADAVVENTNISSGGNNESLKVLGFDDESICFNPALTITGSINMTNSIMNNDFEGTIYAKDTTSPSTNAVVCPSALNAYSHPGEIFNIVNSSFRNFKYIWITNAYFEFKYNFDGCVFDNITYLAASRTIAPESQYNISNSVFLFDDDVIINQQRFEDTVVPNVNFNNNYWGNNSKPTVYFLGNMGIKDETYSPDTWIVLTSEDEQTVIKNLTDGENITAYTGNAPIRTDYADNKGALDYAVVFGPVGYLFTTDDDKNVIFNPEDAMYPFEAADPMDYRTPAVITITGLTGDLGIVGVLVDPVGNPIANATISSFINGENVANVTTDDDGAFTVKGIKNGVLTMLFNGTVDYFDTEYNMTFTNAGKTTKSFINLDTVDSDLKVNGTLVDDEGNPIAGAVITCTLNGENATNVTTDANGVFQVQGASNANISIVFEGSDAADAVNTTISFGDLAPAVVQVESMFNIPGNSLTLTGYAVDTKAGEQGMKYATELLDANGNPISNTFIQFAVNNKIYNRTTYENGSFNPYNLNMIKAGRYTMAFSFGGNENYTSTFAVVCIDLAKKPLTIKASAKTFKASAKSKKYSITLSTKPCSSADGKTYLRSGLKVTLTVGDKDYTAKIDKKGKATFNLKLTKKGKYTAKIATAEDGTYKTATKTVKITIK